MKTILITGIGGDIAQGVASVVREARPRYRIIGVDVHTEHGGTMFVDAFFKVPLATDRGYLTALDAVIQRESVDVVLPMPEPELRVLLPWIRERKDVVWISAGAEVIETGLDKLITAQRLKALGITVPWTLPADVGLPSRYPCIFKMRSGSGSKTFFTVRNEQDALYLAQRYPDCVYQELLEPADREVTCAVYRTADGRVTTLQLLRRLVGGFTGWAKVIQNPDIDAMCNAAAHGLGLRGSMNVQLRLTQDGPRIFEINPRFSSTTLMRHRLGFTDVAWSLDELDGGSVSFPRIEPGGTAVRTQGAALLA